jgi:hypothetical protein
MHAFIDLGARKSLGKNSNIASSLVEGVINFRCVVFSTVLDHILWIHHRAVSKYGAMSIGKAHTFYCPLPLGSFLQLKVRTK